MTCSKLGCSCMATKRPVLSFAAKGHPNAPRARAELGLAVCDEHAVADLDAWVTDVGWAQICTALRRAGRAAPDRGSLRVEFVAMK